MTEPKFTPGPWRVKADPYHFMTLSTVVAGEIGKEGFNRMVVQVGGWNEWKEQEANAHLIAAAPELYEALKYVLKCWDDDRGLLINDSMDKARAALKKLEAE